MSAKNLQFQKMIAETSGGQLPVRGLSTDDIAMLAGQYPEAIRTVFSLLSTGDAKGHDLMPIITQFPKLVSDTIGVATGDYGDEDGMNAVRQIPIPDQIAILTKIGEATFKTTDDVKKFVATVLGLVQGARDTVPALV